MKKQLFFLFLIVFAQILTAQKNVWWFSLSPYIGTGTSLFIHQESLKDNDLNYHLYSPSNFGGLKFAISYNQSIGINFSLSRHYDSQLIDLYDIRNKVNIHEQILHNYWNYAIYIALQTNTGFFTDFGLTLANTVQTALYSPTGDFQTVDITAQIKDFYPTLLFRIGTKPYMSQIIDIATGIQLNYTPQTLITDDFYLTSNYFIHRLANYQNPNLTILNSYIFVGIEYFFGYYGRSSCRKSSFIWNKSNLRRTF